MDALLARRKDDRGFTLIELMVVVLIIGILLAIAIPSFLGARKTAQDTAAQANLRNAMTAAKVYWAKNGGTYTGFTVDKGYIEEPSLPWSGHLTGFPDGTNAITVTGTPGTTLTLALTSQSGASCTAVDSNGPIAITCTTASP